MATFLAKIGQKNGENSKIKITISFCSNPTRNRKFQKNSKKIKKCHYGDIRAKKGQKNLRKIENKNYCFIPFLPDA